MTYDDDEFERKPIKLGIKKFKREQGQKFNRTYNPKKSSLRGKVLRQLKEEAWIEHERRQRGTL